MILRKGTQGELLLIGQTDHSKLVGQFAAHWGNDRFATPLPFEPVARAAAYHDYGWLRYETSPDFIAATSETPEFRQIPASPKQLAAYQWCIDWMTEIDPYSGLMVSMHRTGLWRGRYGTIAYPKSFTRSLVPEVEDFIARNEARQATEREAFDMRQLWTNYRLLQVWDLLGLYFCCQDPGEDHIEPVPTGYGEDRGEGVRLVLKPLGTRRVALDPFPFDINPCPVQLACKRLPVSTWPGKEAFRRAYYQAPTELMNFELV